MVLIYPHITLDRKRNIFYLYVKLSSNLILKNISVFTSGDRIYKYWVKPTLEENQSNRCEEQIISPESCFWKIISSKCKTPPQGFVYCDRQFKLKGIFIGMSGIRGLVNSFSLTCWVSNFNYISNIVFLQSILEVISALISVNLDLMGVEIGLAYRRSVNSHLSDNTNKEFNIIFFIVLNILWLTFSLPAPCYSDQITWHNRHQECHYLCPRPWKRCVRQWRIQGT